MTPPDSGDKRDWLRNYVRKNDESVSIPLPLAQRILAALTHEANRAGASYLGYRDGLLSLASELRAAVERKGAP